MNNAAMVKADITAIPFADRTFDVILCSHVLEHVRIYGWDYVSRLEQAGFTVHQDVYAHDLAPSVIQQHGLPADVVIFHCTKPTSTEETAGFQAGRSVDLTKSEGYQTGQITRMEVAAEKL